MKRKIVLGRKLLSTIFFVTGLLCTSSCDRPKLINQSFSPQEPLVFIEGNDIWTLTPTVPIGEELYFFREDRLMSYKGFTSDAFFAMSPSTYQQFYTAKNQKICAADLLNSELQLYLVLTDNKDVLSSIRNLREGTHIKLQGYHLNMSHSFVKPRDFNFVWGPPQKNAQFVYLEAIE